MNKAHELHFIPKAHACAVPGCPECEKLLNVSSLDPDDPFDSASVSWLENQKRYIKPGTYRVYKQYATVLASFFGPLPLGKFHIGHVRNFQTWRSQRAGATRVNSEVGCVLKQMLREVNRWKFISDVYKPLPVNKTRVRQNMSDEEERRLTVIALDSSKPRRLLAGHCLMVMANTGMGFGELRHLRRGDVFLDDEIPHVTVNEGAKNEFRVRTIPLNWIALRSMRWILRRWQELGGIDDEQFILPHNGQRTEEEKCSKGHKRLSPPDFSRPMENIYRAARGILADAGLDHLNPYDMRSHFCTKLLADPDTSDQLFTEIFGHAKTKTRERYSKQRLQKKAVAVERLCLEEKPTMKLFLISGGRG